MKKTFSLFVLIIFAFCLANIGLAQPAPEETPTPSIETPSQLRLKPNLALSGDLGVCVHGAAPGAVCALGTCSNRRRTVFQCNGQLRCVFKGYGPC